MNITKVELWTNKCYPCHSKEYVPLHQWFLSLGLPLDKFESVRIPLKKEWLEFAQKMKEVNIEPPFVVIRVEDGGVEAFIYRYENFIEQIERKAEMKPIKEKDWELLNEIQENNRAVLEKEKEINAKIKQ